MKRIYLILLSVLSVVILLMASCKKEEEATPNTTPTNTTVNTPPPPPVYESVVFTFKTAEVTKKTVISGKIIWHDGMDSFNSNDYVIVKNYTLVKGDTVQYKINGQLLHTYATYYLTITCNGHTKVNNQYAVWNTGSSGSFIVD